MTEGGTRSKKLYTLKYGFNKSMEISCPSGLESLFPASSNYLLDLMFLQGCF
jgi:hypothetical protein